MTFREPLWLLAGALVLVVLLLHARRRRRVTVASIQIWRLIDASAVRRRTFRWPPPNLLLFLQIAAILLLALALARPVFGDPSDAEHLVYVLDASGSMRTADDDADRFGRARTIVLDRIAGHGEDSRFSVIAVGPTPNLVVARQTDLRGVRAVLDATEAGDGVADWAAAAAALRPVLVEGETARIVVLSDDTDAATALADILPGLEIEDLILGRRAVNAGIEAVVTAGGEGVWHVTGLVAFNGAPPASVSVRFAPERSGAFLDWGAIDLPEPEIGAIGQGGEITFDTELALPGPGILELLLPNDAGPQDNAYRATLQDAGTARVLILGDAPDLVRALQAAAGVEVFAADALPGDDEHYDLVVVADVALERRPETNVLWLARGGLASDDEPPMLPDTAITGWDDEHPLSRDVAWWDLGVTRAFDVPRLEGAAVLAEAGGTPLVQARTTPQGREVRAAIVLDGADWASDPGFPMFVSNLIDWLGVRRGPAAAVACEVGRPCRIEPRLLGGTISLDGREVWRAPLAGAIALPGAEDTFVPDRASLYTLTLGALTQPIAVNGPGVAESAVSEGTVTVGGTGRFSVPPWLVLVALTLAVLVAETLIAGRGPERFLRRLALSSAFPLHQRRRLQLAFRVLSLLFLVAALLQLPLPVREPAENRVVVLGADAGPALVSPENGAFAAMVEAGAGVAEGTGLVMAGAAPTIRRDVGAVGPARATDPDAAPIADLEGALRLAAAMLPSDVPGRIILSSASVETAGRAAAAVAAMADRKVAVDVLPPPAMAPGEVVAETVAAPAAARVGDMMPVQAVILAGAADAAAVRALRNGEIVVEREVDLLAGRNRIDVAIPAGDVEGDLLVEVEVTASGDIDSANNRTGRIVGIGAAPAILVVSPDAEWGDYFAGALAVQGLSATVVAPDRAPYYPRDWLAYDAVILMNVPAIDLTTLQQEQIRDFVRVHGGGLLILGGENAFGPGGYYQTPLEDVSPLSSRVPQDAPLAAMAFVLDRSGSMRAAVGDVTRFDIAKQATVSAIGLLNPESQVTVVVFDSEAHLVVPLQDPKDDAAVEAALAPLTPGGGTVLMPAMEAAFAELRQADAAAKHVVVMTDGLIEQTVDFGPLMAEMRAAGITVSSVAIGDVVDTETLQIIARLGGGSFHATRDFRALPSILSQEALLLSGSPVTERTTPVFWVDRGEPFLAGLPDLLPPLRSYVTTSAQPGATVHLALVDEEGETVPVLASWQYGAGRVLAFASHGAGSGTQDWLAMPQYPLLWSQAIRNFLSAVAGTGLQPRLFRRGDKLFAAADLLDDTGQPVTGAAVTAEPSSGGIAVVLEEVAPGRYEGALGMTAPGSHQFLFRGRDLEVEAGIDVAYPALLDFGRADPDLLPALAAATGGAMMLRPDLPPAPMRWVGRPALVPWLVAALAAFLVDLVIRYAPALRMRNRTAPVAVPFSSMRS